MFIYYYILHYLVHIIYYYILRSRYILFSRYMLGNCFRKKVWLFLHSHEDSDVHMGTEFIA